MIITDPQNPNLLLYTVVEENGGTENVMAPTAAQAISASTLKVPLTAIRHRAVVYIQPKLEVARRHEADFTVPVWPNLTESGVFSDMEQRLATWMVENRLTESDVGSANEMTHKFLTELTNDGEREVFEALSSSRAAVAESLDDHRLTLYAAPGAWLLIDWGDETIVTYPSKEEALCSLDAPLFLNIRVKVGGAREITRSMLQETFE